MLVFTLLLVAIWRTSRFVSSTAWAQASEMQSSPNRETVFALAALNEALWSFFVDKRWRVVWESKFDRAFVLGAWGERSGTWAELARIDWLRGTIDDDRANAWWEQAFLRVPAFKKLVEHSGVSSRNTRGNVVEACVGASFLASHELAASRAPAASGATNPRFRF